MEGCKDSRRTEGLRRLDESYVGSKLAYEPFGLVLDGLVVEVIDVLWLIRGVRGMGGLGGLWVRRVLWMEGRLGVEELTTHAERLKSSSRWTWG